MTLGKGGTNCGVLKKCFDLQGKEIVSIVGSGGKTSLMWALAKTYRKEAVLVSTTTKIGFPQRQLYDYFYTNHFEKITPNICGITLAGTAINNQTKLTMPAMTSFQTLFQHFTKVFRSGWVQTTTFERLVLL